MKYWLLGQLGMAIHFNCCILKYCWAPHAGIFTHFYYNPLKYWPLGHEGLGWQDFLVVLKKNSLGHAGIVTHLKTLVSK